MEELRIRRAIAIIKRAAPEQGGDGGAGVDVGVNGTVGVSVSVDTGAGVNVRVGEGISVDGGDGVMVGVSVSTGF